MLFLLLLLTYLPPCFLLTYHQEPPTKTGARTQGVEAIMAPEHVEVALAVSVTATAETQGLFQAIASECFCGHATLGESF